MTKQNRERIEKLWMEHSKKRWPSVPDHARTKFPHKDGSTNGLTNCVISFLQLSGHQAERVSNMGRVIDNSKTVSDVTGQKRKIGSTKYIPGTGTKGTADIHAIIHGMAVRIEIKFGRDVQSEAQKKYQKTIEAAGGIYKIIKTFDEFLVWYDDIENKIREIKGKLF